MKNLQSSTIQDLQKGDCFYKIGDGKQRILQYHKYDAIKDRYIAVEPSTPENLRDKVHMQVWFHPGMFVVKVPSDREKY
jgi:hypothetical protein